jgi:hypothetical protein
MHILVSVMLLYSTLLYSTLLCTHPRHAIDHDLWERGVGQTAVHQGRRREHLTA